MQSSGLQESSNIRDFITSGVLAAALERFQVKWKNGDASLIQLPSSSSCP